MDSLGAVKFVIDPDKCKKGYIYVLFNQMYKYYGENIYKIGETENCGKRIYDYSTPYIENPLMVYKSQLLIDCRLAESLIFDRLKDCRLRHNREFFRCPIERIKSTIDEVSSLLLDPSCVCPIKTDHKFLIIPSKKIELKPHVIRLKCHLCGYLFTQRSHLYRHLRRQHQIDPLETLSNDDHSPNK